LNRILLPERSVVTPKTEHELFGEQMEQARINLFIAGIHRFAKDLYGVSIKTGRNLSSDQIPVAIKAQVDALHRVETEAPIMPEAHNLEHEGFVDGFSLQEHYAAWALMNLLDWAHERKLRIAGCALALHYKDIENIKKQQAEEAAEHPKLIVD
jgi:hypothetical protein